jgi:crotonobetainyl-CoA:carnitine CoA-transferase CaiB-like acyl-CoA transferase
MGALDGLKVLEAGLLVQGPQASATMHDWGADVIKVELPNFGDQARWLITPTGGRCSSAWSNGPTWSSPTSRQG